MFSDTCRGEDGIGDAHETTVSPIILGSSSAWRREVMNELGCDFETMSPDIDEKAIRCSDPLELPVAVARAKAAALESRLSAPSILITGDQIVLAPKDAHNPPAHAEDVRDGMVVHEKPESRAEAEEFIRGYSGRFVRTVAAVVVTHTGAGKEEFGVDIATVHFRVIPDDAIAAALEPTEDGQPSPLFSTCGAVCIEHPALAPYVERIEGTRDSVFGLPKTLLAQLLEKVGAPSPANPPSMSPAGAAALTIAARQHG